MRLTAYAARMADRNSPTLNARRLGMHLKRLRVAANLKSDEAATELEWSPAKMSKIENARTPVSAADLRALLDLYDASSDDAALAHDLRRKTREESWWQRLGVKPNTFADFEGEATRIRTNDPLILPGLLQTDEYAATTIRALDPRLTAEEVDRAVQVRARRAALLHKPGAALLWCVIGEAALRTEVGGPNVMAQQLRHLVDVADELRNVTVQVLPFSAGAHTGLDGSFALLSYDPPDPELAYTEGVGGAVWLESSDEVRRVSDLFDHLLGVSLEPRESLRFIRRLADGMNEDDHR
jgi:transcriptional regulator with XRE-family HTH domain